MGRMAGRKLNDENIPLTKPRASSRFPTTFVQVKGVPKYGILSAIRVPQEHTDSPLDRSNAAKDQWHTNLQIVVEVY